MVIRLEMGIKLPFVEWDMKWTLFWTDISLNPRTFRTEALQNN
jgi:hypothetical protein